jgi:protein-tyrosine-phosphatase
MRIIFICKYNRFRSKVAEFLYNQLSGDKAISAGIIEVDQPLLPEEKQRNKYLKETYNIELNAKSKGIKVSDLLKSDKIIIVANDIPKNMFSNKKWKNKVVVWGIPDEPAANKKNIDKSVEMILNKVKKLVKEK